MTSSNLPAGAILALYNGGQWGKYQNNTFAALFKSLRMDGYLLHAGPRGILGQDPDQPDSQDPTGLIAWLRKLHQDAGLPAPSVWLGLGLDGWTQYLGQHLLSKQHPLDMDRATDAAEATVRTLFEQVGAFAVANGAVSCMADPEAASKTQPSAGRVMARLFIEALDQHAPGVLISHTTYDGPIAVEWPQGSHHYWGGHLPYPFDAWLGAQGPALKVVLEARQNYTAAGSGLSPVGSVPWRCARSDDSFRLAIQKGIVRPDLPLLRYLQAHNTHRYDTLTVGMQENLLFFWAAGTPGTEETLDAEGTCALAQLMKLRRLGYYGPGSVDRFLTDAKAQGLYSGAIDHAFGPGAEAALAKMPG